MPTIVINPKYYSVKDIKVLENCGKDRAYALAKELPHERRGKNIFVFAEAYEEYYRKKMEDAREKKKESNLTNVYNIRQIF